MDEAKISIASALRRAKRIKGQIAEQTQRAKVAAFYEEEKEPAFKFSECIAKRAALVQELLRIEVEVAKANAVGTLANGQSVLASIRQLGEIRSEIAFYRELTTLRTKPRDTDTVETTDYDMDLGKHVRREKKTTYVSAITQVQRAERIEQLQLAFEQLNASLESFNHITNINVLASLLSCLRVPSGAPRCRRTQRKEPAGPGKIPCRIPSTNPRECPRTAFETRTAPDRREPIIERSAVVPSEPSTVLSHDLAPVRIPVCLRAILGQRSAFVIPFPPFCRSPPPWSPRVHFSAILFRGASGP